MRRALVALFPELLVEGSTHSPGAARVAASRALSALLYVALAYLIGGAQVLRWLGIAEPHWAAVGRENKLALFAGYFILNGITAKLQSTGAFEVALNGKLLWSKLAEGGVPPLEVIARAVARETGWLPDLQLAAQLGLSDPRAW